MTDSLGDVTQYTYQYVANASGKSNLQVTVTLPNPATGQTSGSTLITQYVYNSMGELLSTTDANGNTTAYGYDAAGNLLAVHQPDSVTGLPNDANYTHYEYDAYGNLTSLTDPDGNVTAWWYDNLNRVTHENDYGDVTTRYYYNYDAAGNVSQTTDRDGRVTQYFYDNLHRETGEQWYDADSNLTDTLTYTYYASGNLESASDDSSNGSSSYTYTYDELGRLTSSTATIAGLTPTVTLSEQYDANSNRTQLSATIGGTADFVNNYQYDNLDRMTQITQTGQSGGNAVDSKQVDLSYLDNGLLQTVSRYEGLGTSNPVAESSYGYDHTDRLTSLSYTYDSTTLASYAYTYDSAGRITQMKSSADAASGYSWGVVDYTYDSTNQLQTATYTTYANAPSDEDYSYDANGNRTDQSTGSGNQMYEDAAGNTYTYDGEGNRTGKLLTDGTSIVYAYDNRNRLVSVTYKDDQGNTTETINYTYDVFDRLVGKTVSGASTDREAYVYDGENILLKLQNSTGNALTNANLVRRFLYGPAIDQVFAEEVVSGSTSVETRWLLADNEGTIRDVAVYNQGATNVVDHLVYDSFGNVAHESGSAHTPTFTYTGRQYDADSGLFYYRARWYDSTTGQFISHDPLNLAGDVNLYRYCGNNPTNFTDPLGASGGSGGSGGGWSGQSGNGSWGGQTSDWLPSAANLPKEIKTPNNIPKGVEDMKTMIQKLLNSPNGKEAIKAIRDMLRGQAPKQWKDWVKAEKFAKIRNITKRMGPCVVPISPLDVIIAWVEISVKSLRNHTSPIQEIRKKNLEECPPGNIRFNPASGGGELMLPNGETIPIAGGTHKGNYLCQAQWSWCLLG